MKLIVGLGNVGKEYENTRHNVGFMVIDSYIKTKKLTPKEKFNGEFYEEMINGEKIIYLKPQSFVNASGTVVLSFVDYFKINISDVIVIYDDMSFEIGKYKIKSSGSSAGHNGMNDIIEKLKSEDIKRIRIGISKNKRNIIKYVLGHFSKKEQTTINEVVNKVMQIVKDYPTVTFENLMNKYN